MSVYEIVFSPTGGTEKVAHIVGGRWSKDATKIDLSVASGDFSKYHIEKDDMVLIAMPSFGGRAPAIAIEHLKKIKGNGAKCTLICIYGNRDYEDTLVEMEDAAKECGFQIIAAIAAVAEHSIMPQYASGRPDTSDQKLLAGFADRIMTKDYSAPTIPGSRPYKKAGGVGLVPAADKSCVGCGLCARQCPAQAIDPGSLKADAHLCISCMRCVKRCPKQARKVNGAIVSIASLAIKKACSTRKENQLFL